MQPPNSDGSAPGARAGSRSPRQWLPGALLTGLLAAYATRLLVETAIGLHLFDPSFPLSTGMADLGSFYESGRAAARGLNPYGVYPLVLYAERGPAAAVNLNAPFSAVLFAPLALAEPGDARRGWYVASLAAFIGVVTLLQRTSPGARQPWRIAWALGLAGIWETLRLGQVYAFLALASTAAWLLLASRPVTAGVVLGLVIAVKPTFVVWALALLLAGHTRAGRSALLAAGLLGAAPLLVSGAGVYGQWLAVASIEAVSADPANASLSGVLARLGAQPLARVLSGLLLGAVAVWAWRCRPDARRVSGVALVVLLLAAPLAWVGYSVFLLPIFFGLRWTSPLKLAAGLLLVPLSLVQYGASVAPPALAPLVGSVYCVAWLLVLVETVRAGRPMPRSFHRPVRLGRGTVYPRRPPTDVPVPA